MIKICLVSLGCVKNLVDSEAILAIFRSGDFEIVSAPKDSDVIIVNTCGFILDAKIEGIDTILEMAKYKKNHLQAIMIKKLEGDFLWQNIRKN